MAGQRTLCLVFLYLLSGIATASAQTGSSTPTVGTVIARMAQARAENRALFRSYVVTRDYNLFGKERETTKAEVTAEVTFVPPSSKKYDIQESSGSGLGKFIVNRMLARETQITRDYTSTDISPSNYDFRFVREEEFGGHRCYVLEQIPRRKDSNLLHGNAWVDANTYLLHRFEGEPAKNPSWWVRDVRLIFDYSEVGGMWLQTASEATAHVQILGQSTVVSRDMKYEISEAVAAKPAPKQALRPPDATKISSIQRDPARLAQMPKPR